MPFAPIIPAGSGKPLAPYSPGALADGVLYVAGTLPLDAGEKELLKGFQLLTAKPVLYVCNVEEATAAAGNELTDRVLNGGELGFTVHYGRLDKVVPGFCFDDIADFEDHLVGLADAGPAPVAQHYDSLFHFITSLTKSTTAFRLSVTRL